MVESAVVAPERARLCAVDDCERRVSARGWCSMHYKRWSKYGDPLMVKHQHTPPPGAFLSSDAVAMAGVTYRQLDYWSREGYVVPSVQQTTGSGSSRFWSAEDIQRLRVMRRLTDVGVYPAVAARAAQSRLCPCCDGSLEAIR